MSKLFRFARHQPRLAMMTCIRNEERFLPPHLAYHRAIGVERAYVFLDRCSDDSERILASLPWVHVFKLDATQAERFQSVTDMQRLCMDYALNAARDEGIEWLMMIDVDEFATANNRFARTAVERCNLLPMLAKTPRKIDAITLPVCELLPTHIDDQTPFWTQQYFLTDRRQRRVVLDPRDGELKEWLGFVGHTFGKSIIRTSANVQAFDCHSWTSDQGRHFPYAPGWQKVSERRSGELLHFMTTDWRQWRDKYRKLAHEPSRWPGGGEVEFPKQCWKEAATRMSESEAREYFRRWVATPTERCDELVREGAAQQVDVVTRVLDETRATLDGTSQSDRVVTSRPIAFPEANTTVGDGPHQGDQECLRFRMRDAAFPPMRGFYGLEFDGDRWYRWTKPAASVLLQLPSDDYALSIRLHPTMRWGRRVKVVLDGYPLPDRDVSVHDNLIEARVDHAHFDNGEEHRLQLDFPPRLQRGRLGNNEVGAAIEEIAFHPRVTARAA